MSTAYIGAELRRLVAARADYRCEYCRIHEEDAFFSYHIDHIISEKHGGPTQAGNLAYACTFCNLRKGSDIASVAVGGALTRLFHPRIDQWSHHFGLQGPTIETLTPIGEATARLLAFNAVDRLLERRLLQASGRYPVA